MKHSFELLAAALLLAGSASAQKLKIAQVPAAVVAGFTQKFPQAKEVKWEKENDHYEASFKQGKAEMSALLSANGALVETETEISVAQLPAEERAMLGHQYKGLVIKEATKIVAAGTGAVTYEAEIAQSGKTRNVLFNAAGQEVKQ